MWPAFTKLFHEGGWVLYPIFLISIIAWYIAFGKMAQLTGLVRGHKNFLRRLRGPQNSQPAGRPHALYEGLFERISQSMSRSERERARDEFLVAASAAIDRRLPTMNACVVIAPLLGLLGTITGMNTMFSVISKFGFGNPAIMANGISMALEATLTGLGVAVAALFLHHYLLNRKTKIFSRIKADFKEICSAVPACDPKTTMKGNAMRADYRLIPDESDRPEINLAPFVDTIMILLIFFVVTANLYVETGVDVSKPKAQSAKTVGQKALLIGVTREGTVHVYGRQISLPLLRIVLEQEVAKQPDLSVVIISDRDASVGAAVGVMDQCAMAGAHKVSLAAEKK